LEELRVRRFADIQEEMCFRAVWRWATLESKLRGWNEKKSCVNNKCTRRLGDFSYMLWVFFFALGQLFPCANFPGEFSRDVPIRQWPIIGV